VAGVLSRQEWRFVASHPALHLRRLLHAVLGWPFRGRKVVQGTAVYCTTRPGRASRKWPKGITLLYDVIVDALDR
jgi:hypothetical protein